jgi:hypothetical protein
MPVTKEPSLLHLVSDNSQSMTAVGPALRLAGVSLGEDPVTHQEDLL